jgi:glycosyltransferase involved in cell wall biosynthesis
VPFFSVIIPTCNRAALLNEALASVKAQRFTDYELIVVDDGSTDQTPRIVDSCGLPILYLRQENQGPGAARNLAIASASGEYVAFLDSDDLWFPWTLSTYWQAIRQGLGPAFTCGCGSSFAARSSLLETATPALQLTRYPDYFASGAEPIWIGTCSVAVKTTALREVGGFPKENWNAEDADLWMKLGVAPGFLRIKSPPVFSHRLTPNSAVAAQTRNYLGIKRLLDREKQGLYPGGTARAQARRAIITRHVRPASLHLLECHEFHSAFDLYRSTFLWHLHAGRLKYLLGFPLFAARASTRGSAHPPENEYALARNPANSR